MGRSARKSISRDGLEPREYALTNAVGTTPIIPWRSESYGMIYIPSGSPITRLDFYVHLKEAFADGATMPSEVNLDFVANDVVGTKLIIDPVAPDGAYPTPAELFGAHWVKIVANFAGSVYLTAKG